MIKFTPLIISIGFIEPTVVLPPKHNFSYETLYKIETSNKNTFEYNYIRSDDLIKDQNEKLLEEIFFDKAINENTR